MPSLEGISPDFVASAQDHGKRICRCNVALRQLRLMLVSNDQISDMVEVSAEAEAELRDVLAEARLIHATLQPASPDRATLELLIGHIEAALGDEVRQEGDGV